MCAGHGFIFPKFWDETSKQYLENTTTYTLSIPTGGNISRAAFASLLTAPSLRQVEEVPIFYGKQFRRSLFVRINSRRIITCTTITTGSLVSQYLLIEGGALKQSHRGNGFSGSYQPPKRAKKTEKRDSLPELVYNFVSLYRSVKFPLFQGVEDSGVWLLTLILRNLNMVPKLVPTFGSKKHAPSQI